MYKVRKFKVVPFVVLIIVICFILFAGVIGVKVVFPLHYQPSINKYAEENKLDPPLVAAVIKTESNFNPFAQSKKDARGLMQITPQTGKWIAECMGLKAYNDDMLFDPDFNIKLGCWYIHYLYNYYDGNYELAFAAYNGGSGNVDKWLKNAELSRNGKQLDVIPFLETDQFVKRIEKYYKFYRHIYKWDTYISNAR